MILKSTRIDSCEQQSRARSDPRTPLCATPQHHNVDKSCVLFVMFSAEKESYLFLTYGWISHLKGKHQCPKSKFKNTAHYICVSKLDQLDSFK